MKTTKTNVPGLVKVDRTPLILNTNMGDYQKILNDRMKKKEDDMFKEEFTVLKNEVKELKDSIRLILEALQGK